jgi:hypothetical protein
MKFIDLFEAEKPKKTIKDYQRKFENPLEILRQSGIKIAYHEPFIGGYFIKFFKNENIEKILKDFDVTKADDLTYIVKFNKDDR